MTVALLVGRFQPPHNGHKQMIIHVLENVDELIVLIGSSRKHHTTQNPFTAEERVRMFKAALAGQAGRVHFIPIPDVGDDDLWGQTVLELAPAFDVVYSNTPRERKIFSGLGFKVEDVPLYDRSILSATEVRRRMREGGDWKALVPPEVAEVIEEIGGAQRAREAAK